MNTVNVGLGGRSYDVVIGDGLIAEAGQRIAPILTRPRVAVLTDETVAGLWLPALEDAFGGAGITLDALALPPGETTKAWAWAERSCSWLLDVGVERGDLIVALGGGVIGDLTGFAAAVLRRGVRFVQIPTTLLAQVDSSVGGKTGINTAQGKNLIGAFHQPVLVLADTATLATLPLRQHRSGYAEVVKYAALGDAGFFRWLEEDGEDVLDLGPASVAHAVRRSVEMKAAIVARDETETGERALLNLGHTFGHALEAATGYSDRLLHGEAVALGMGLAADLSARLGLCSDAVAVRLRAVLRSAGLPVALSELRAPLPDADGLVALMMQDKKVADGKLRMILLRDIGAAFVTADIPKEVLCDVLDAALSDRASVS
jgi:3-dehydroquinate synthase